MMACGIEAGGGGALRDDHDEARSRDRNQGLNLAPGHRGQREPRQSAHHRTDDFDAALREIPVVGGEDRAGDRDQRARNARREAMKAEDERDHRNRERRGQEMNVFDVSGYFDQLIGRL